MGKGKDKDRRKAEDADLDVAPTAQAPRAVSLEDAPLLTLPSRTASPAASYLPVAAQREQVRTALALGLLATLVLLSLGYSSALLAGAVSANDVTKLLAGVFTPILGVFGAVTGFYYGSHAADGGGG